ncbi:hypothetical protein AB0L68_37655 [Streptomyces sp. NPDC052164]|uniref:hypothetical protein n=1 Tax=Streptomyces sp. NPDC052164 TaxID=3155529 RepID=UPI00342CEC82
MATALQNWVTRTFDIFDPVVVTVGRLHAGAQQNVIPDTAESEATVRSCSEAGGQRRGRALGGRPRLPTAPCPPPVAGARPVEKPWALRDTAEAPSVPAVLRCRSSRQRAGRVGRFSRCTER